METELWQHHAGCPRLSSLLSFLLKLICHRGQSRLIPASASLCSQRASWPGRLLLQAGASSASLFIWQLVVYVIGAGGRAPGPSLTQSGRVCVHKIADYHLIVLGTVCCALHSCVVFWKVRGHFSSTSFRGCRDRPALFWNDLGPSVLGIKSRGL